MATVLKRGEKIPLNFTPGTILVLIPTPAAPVKRFLPILYKASAPAKFEFHLALWNKNWDALLIILFSAKFGVGFIDRARRSLGDGLGERQYVDMTQVDLKGRSLLEVKVSVYYYLTDSEFGRYQILLDGKTVYHFDVRFPGPVTQIFYRNSTGTGPPSWVVDVYQIDDLPSGEQLALGQRGAPLEIPSRNSTAISIRPPFHSISNQAYASISWEDGKEIRLYYLGPGNVLHEYAYSASKDKNSLYYGNLHTLKIVLDPTSSIAAIRFEDDIICIYYQDPNTDFIRTVKQCGPMKPWNEALPFAKAVKGSSFAIIRDPTNKRVSRIYYQDPELHLRECCYHHLGTMGQWVFGGFNPGVQRRGTPIMAEVVQDGDVDINVTWRDARGCVASGSWSKSSGWHLPNPNGEIAPLDGRD